MKTSSSPADHFVERTFQLDAFQLGRETWYGRKTMGIRDKKTADNVLFYDPNSNPFQDYRQYSTFAQKG